VQFCIAEWSDGTCEEASFREKDVSNSYDAYLADIQKWASFNPAVTTNKRKKLFKRACKSAGVETTNIVPQLTGDAEERARKELEEHTGKTDSEAEDNYADGAGNVGVGEGGFESA
ncbi:hypothetical protein DXG03_003812, partial [Asterophora parasitica]